MPAEDFSFGMQELGIFLTGILHHAVGQELYPGGEKRRGRQSCPKHVSHVRSTGKLQHHTRKPRAPEPQSLNDKPKVRNRKPKSVNPLAHGEEADQIARQIEAGQTHAEDGAGPLNLVYGPGKF